MLFKIVNPYVSHPITCVVAVDGRMFFKAIDVSKIAGYSNPSQHARRTTDVTVKDIVYKKKLLGHLPKSLLKTRLYDADHIDKIFRPHENCIWEMFESQVVLSRSSRPTFKIKEAVSVALVRHSNTTFKDFFDEFQEQCLAFYERIIVRDTLLYKVPTKGSHVERYGTDNYPLVIRRTFHDDVKKTILYRRIF